jgi:hypothetical protein
MTLERRSFRRLVSEEASYFRCTGTVHWKQTLPDVPARGATGEHQAWRSMWQPICTALAMLDVGTESNERFFH